MDITASEATEQKQVRIFFCYARKDELLLNQLKNHLQPLQRQGLIKLWYDREIRAGSEWESVIKKQLDMAQIILLLVSPDFMASDYCYSIEMQRALERHQRGEATVIPIILRPVYWHGEPLGRLQALPTDGKPVTDSDWHDPDRAFFNITNGIYQVIEKLTAASPIVSPTGTINDRRLEAVKSENTTTNTLQREKNAPFPTPHVSEQPAKPLPSFKSEAFSLLRTLWHGKPIRVVAFSPDGQTLASGGSYPIKLWNLVSGKEVRTFTERRRSLWSQFLNPSLNVNYLAFGPDGQTLVSGEWEQTVILWSLASGKEIQTFTKHAIHSSSVNDYEMAFSPDGLMLARYSLTKIKLWNITFGGEVHTLPGYAGSVLAFSPDGLTLVSCSYDGMIRLWDLATGKEINTLPGHKGLRHLAFSPNGLMLASESNENGTAIIKVWNLLTREEVCTLKYEHTSAANKMAFSSDGLTLAKGSYSPDVIRVWNLPTHEEVCTLTGHTSSVSSVAFSSDGQILASGSFDGTIKIWGKK